MILSMFLSVAASNGKLNLFVSKIFIQYYQQIKQIVIMNIYSGCQDDIEDCIQEVFLAAASNHDLISHPNIAGWLIITAKNKVKQANAKYIRQYKHLQNIDDCIISSDYDIEEAMICKIDMERFERDNILKKIFDELTYDEKVLYRMRWTESKSYAEIELKTGQTHGAVKNQIYRLRKKLLNLIKKYTK